jgi:photosystem II stability/assembly factor-like uncharacterized protein
MISRLVFLCLFCFWLIPANVRQLNADESRDPDKVLFESLKFRCIGPFRGGRSAAVTGVRGNPMLYYMGAAGGGVWKTTDGGSSWANISDGFFGGSMGAIAVAPSDSNIIYAGGGEKSVRGNVSHGYGIWKSYDAGKTWVDIGLNDSRRIPRIRIHPANPDIVYAAVLGHLFGPNQQRGVFRSIDGGKNWERILFVNEDAGAFDLIIDPNNPRVLYATSWRVRRTPYSLESGGEGSGIWKTTDGGDNWKEITRNNGLPQGTIGICGIAVSPVDSNRVWAMLEAEDGGLFRSDDAGKNWTRINKERKLRQRAWYYSRVFAGPKNKDEVYVLNVRFWRSIDGGKSFTSIRTPHGDHHDLWIDPDNPDRMIIGDDGGGQVSYDRGASWSTYMNQPTSQFYRVTTDNHFPYRIYGAQQDNSTVRILHRSRRGTIGERDWEPTAGGESGHIAPDPLNPDIVYGGSYGGYLSRYNHETGEVRNIHIWPDNPLGHGAGDGKYRFQWNFPLFFSRHDPQTLFAAANVLFKTNDGGGSWTRISNDLTRNDASKLGPSGGPITKDNTGVEYYCTIFAATESIHDPNVIWAGSDDGLLHITRDGGKNWENVTPPDLPEWMQINCIEPHPTEPGGLYIAGTKYKLDDFKPYLYKTTDYGKTWLKIVDGIDLKHFTRAIRADAVRPGLLYAGTESGLYISFDDGENWKSFQCNLPVVPITDLALKDKDLIVATQGRSFWILDDLSCVHQWSSEAAAKPVKLFATRPVYRMRGRGGSSSRTAGQNIAGGVNLRFWIKELPDEKSDCRLTISSTDEGESVVFRRQDDKQNGKAAEEQSDLDDLTERKLKVAQGMNTVNWDMRVNKAKNFEGMVIWGGGLQGPLVVPGTYKAELTVGEWSDEITIEILKDPRSQSTNDDLQAQYDFLIGVRDKLTETHLAISNLRDVKKQIKTLLDRIRKQDEYKDIVEAGEMLVEKLSNIETRLYQTQNQSPQDPLNFPIRLNNRLSSLVGVVSMGDNAPTKQAISVRDELTAEIDQELSELSNIFDTEIVDFNRSVLESSIPAILVNQHPDD